MREHALNEMTARPSREKKISGASADGGGWVTERKQGDREGDWQGEMLALFIRNQLKVALALPVLAVLFVVAFSGWTSTENLLSWLVIVLLTQAVQLILFRMYEDGNGPVRSVREWVSLIATSEFLLGAAWSLPLHFFWSETGTLQNMFIIAVLMAVVAVRILISASFMPVVLAGAGVITFNIVLRSLDRGDPLYFAMGALAVIIGLFFIQLARRLQSAAREMLLIRSQRERLIDELKRERDRAEHARIRAEEASRAKSLFLATMSHELRTPLNAIMGFSEIISSEMLGPLPVPQYKEYAGDIHQSGTYLLSLINDILDLSRIEAGKRELREEVVDVVEQARECMHLVDIRAREKNHRLRLEVEDGLPMLLADTRAVRQIWLNLLSNAIKFTPSGGTITLGVRELEEGGLEMSVSDTGEGIPEEELRTVMDSFGRGNSAVTRAVEGAGLGLPIVNGLARLHDADVTIDTQVDEGTTVRVVFPSVRVLDDGHVQAGAVDHVKSPTQRRLIQLTA